MDADTQLLKWVAEELLGWEYTPVSTHFGDAYFFKKYKAECSEKQMYETLKSWHGIGLVVEEMERRGWTLVSILHYYAESPPIVEVKFVHRTTKKPAYGIGRSIEKLHEPVFAAAKKAVEG